MVLKFRKIVLHNKIIDKTRTTKNQENSKHHFGEKLSNIKNDLNYLRASTGYNSFYYKFVKEGFITCFNLSRKSKLIVLMW